MKKEKLMDLEFPNNYSYKEIKFKNKYKIIIYENYFISKVPRNYFIFDGTILDGEKYYFYDENYIKFKKK
jgi:hypothetical protein